MKKIVFASSLLALAGSSWAQGPEITSWYLNTTGATGYNGIAADVQSVCYDNNYVYVEATGIPSYTIGPWPGNPNTPSNQDWFFKIPRNPQAQTGTHTAVGNGQVAVMVNGMVAFGPSDARSYNNQNVWHQDAWMSEGSTMDTYGGHPDQGGTYHTHAIPTGLYSSDNTQHSPIIGYAFDGYPIYGPFGYNDPNDAASAIVRIESSYQLRNIANRQTLPDGTTLQPSQYGPTISAQYPLGTYMEDYEYVQASGHLDQYNGRFAKTPEYPNGIYAYFLTVGADETTPAYPYLIGPTAYYGVVTTSNMGPTGGQGTTPAGTTCYDPTATSVATAASLDLRVYPNPASTELYVEYSNNQVAQARLVTVLGQIVLETTLQTGLNTLALPALPKGVYTLELIGTEGTSSQLVQIQ